MVRRDHQTKWMPKTPLPQEPPISVEDLDASILTVAYVDKITIDDDRMGGVKLTGSRALHAPAKQFVPVLVELQHTRISIAIFNVDVALSVPRNILRLIEMPHVVSENSHSTENKQSGTMA